MGFEKDYIREKIERKFEFQFLLFNKQDVQVFEADWKGIIQAVRKLFHEISEETISVEIVEELEKVRLEEVENELGVSLFKARSEYDLHKFHEDYYSLEKFLSIVKPTVHHLRAFLYHSLGLRELFKGDGYIYDVNGERKSREFLAINKLRKDIPSLRVQILKL